MSTSVLIPANETPPSSALTESRYFLTVEGFSPLKSAISFRV
ncbi:hypothetical protein SbBS512_0032 (plasmid) [Shigella boydii CDC 3083-94]|uniref:Uncharacterized protein n=2 Tax=Enterobacteriaceae TaxID=543 RepID=T1RT97_ECOLX|nr:hypothetical protein SbBS512_0032 [Shigella boydii CDC 3083-94]AGO32866.1 hypothetical protein [Escherichia coli]UVD62278.1 LuxR family transcriptional regulator [Escherichia coli]